MHTAKVVNDTVERGIKLNIDYAATLTDDERQKSSLIRAVEKHRQD